MTRTIRSANAEYQDLVALRVNRQTRNRENAFIVEGVRNIDAALARNWTVRSGLVPEGGRRSAWAEKAMAQVEDQVVLAPGLFDALTDREERPELLLVVEKRTVSLTDLVVDETFVATLLDRPANPGNIGTIIRSCDALGGTVLLITGHGADPFDPRAVRASTGSFFAVPIVDVSGAEVLRAWAEAAGVTLIATDEGGDAFIDDLPRPPVALLFGNETSGLSRALRDVARRTVAIPMMGSASSLNVAAAHAVMLFSVKRG